MKIKHPMKTGINHAWLALVALVLTGCGTPGAWEWNVARLHNLENMKGQTFTIVPLRRENLGSAEFKAYATMMATQLAHYGLTYSPTEETGKTDYVVGLDYGSADRSSMIIATPSTASWEVNHAISAG